MGEEYQARILVVDDTAARRSTTLGLLRYAGYQTLEARSGNEGLLVATDHSPDLVILNGKLPDMNGQEFCRRIRGTPQSAATLMIQPAAIPPDADWANPGTESGADIALSEPPAPPALLAQVKLLLRVRQAEQKLRHSQEHLARAQAVAHLGSWEWDVTTGQITWSAEMYRLLGLAPGQFTPTYETVMAMGHPGERSELEHTMKQALSQRRPWSFEARYLRPDHSWVVLQGQAEAVYDAEGRPWRVTGIALDVTERKQNETALRQNEQLFRSIIDNAGAAIYAKDLQGCFILSNRHHAMLLGCSPAEVLGRTDADFLGSAEATKTYRANDRQVLERGQAQEFEEIVRVDNAQRVYRSIKFPLRNLDGNIEAVCGISTEITDLKRIAATLQESERRLHLALEAGRMGTWQWAVGTPRVEWSEGHYWLLGYQVGEVTPSYAAIRSRVHPEDLERLEGMFRECLEQRSDLFCEFRVVWPDGSVHWLEARGRCVYDEQGQAKWMHGVLVDIDPKKQGEAALRQAKDELVRANQTLERQVQERTASLRETIGELEAFSYSLSHDLRAPLRAIKGFTEMVLSTEANALSSPGAEMLNRVMSAAHRLDRLIQEVLTFCRLSHQEMDLHTVDVDKLVREITRDHPELQPPNANVQIDSPLLPMCGDEVSLTQCLANLLGNAVKFVAPGVKPEVRVYSEMLGDQVRLWVADNGIGIPREAHQRVFELFQRNHPTAAYEGTGIGLAIVRKAAARMGGTAGVESEPGQGSRFWIQLPPAGVAQSIPLV